MHNDPENWEQVSETESSLFSWSKINPGTAIEGTLIFKSLQPEPIDQGYFTLQTSSGPLHYTAPSILCRMLRKIPLQTYLQIRYTGFLKRKGSACKSHQFIVHARKDTPQ